MATCSIRNLVLVCKAKGLDCIKTKKGYIWRGIINGEHQRIAIHKHNEGRDIPDGLFRKYVKQLGFNNQQEFFNYLNNIK